MCTDATMMSGKMEALVTKCYICDVTCVALEKYRGRTIARKVRLPMQTLLIKLIRADIESDREYYCPECAKKIEEYDQVITLMGQIEKELYELYRRKIGSWMMDAELLVRHDIDSVEVPVHLQLHQSNAALSEMIEQPMGEQYDAFTVEYLDEFITDDVSSLPIIVDAKTISNGDGVLDEEQAIDEHEQLDFVEPMKAMKSSPLQSPAPSFTLSPTQSPDLAVSIPLSAITIAPLPSQSCVVTRIEQVKPTPVTKPAVSPTSPSVKSSERLRIKREQRQLPKRSTRKAPKKTPKKRPTVATFTSAEQNGTDVSAEESIDAGESEDGHFDVSQEDDDGEGDSEKTDDAAGESGRVVCDICGKSYKTKSALSLHINVHTQKNAHECNICGRGFTQRGALVRHMPMHTGEKPYQCDVCGKRFSHYSSFHMHQIIHTNERKKKCRICGIELRSNSHMTRHMRVHTGEKPFACPVCGQKFAQRYNMTTHYNTHQGIHRVNKKIHPCFLCPQKFVRRPRYTKHLADEHLLSEEQIDEILQNADSEETREIAEQIKGEVQQPEEVFIEYIDPAYIDENEISEIL